MKSWSAARPVGRGVARGELQLTDTHVVFEPKGLASRVDGTRFSVALTFVAAVAGVPGTGGFFSGGKAPQLCLTLGDGSQWMFVVKGLDDAVEAISERIGT
ncbi:MAG: hypothetical protein QM774_11430 [Gordonia sp. (in: high G+C Gram-positive bacteria)]|uniref:hypothetical protein n=1 Tax=Gordonia sp. (in: high G+C Gram-positive bacteria) TaxID=84139 RepID=UPI0039E3983D